MFDGGDRHPRQEGDSGMPITSLRRTGSIPQKVWGTDHLDDISAEDDDAVWAGDDQERHGGA